MSLFKNKHLLAFVLGMCSLAYPLIVYVSWQNSALILVLCLLFGGFLRSLLQKQKPLILLSGGLALFVISLLLIKPTVATLLYPVLMSSMWSLYMTYTLYNPPTFIERFARLTQPNLSQEGIHYSRQITKVWIGFCTVNAMIALITVLINNLKWWTLYNGLISYVLMGLLFSIEFCYRKLKIEKKQLPMPVRDILKSKTKQEWALYWGESAGPLTDFPALVFTICNLAIKNKHQRVVVHIQDRAYFLAALLAAYYAKLPLILPACHATSGFKACLIKNDLVLTENNELLQEIPGAIDPSHLVPNGCTDKKQQYLEHAQFEIVFYTSGSTGKSKAITKKIEQLEKEINLLEKLWPGNKDRHFFSTVSVQHIYGLLYSLLWPVCTHQKLSRQTHHFLDGLFKKVSTKDVIISSPTHLRYIDSVMQLIHPPAIVFSSGGPLKYPFAKMCYEKLGYYPTEILGSTETGGIAHRTQEKENQSWTPLPAVRILKTKNQLLTLTSGFLLSDTPLETQDKIQWVSKREFVLLGRKDSIVKVEGKRISLQEIQNYLENSPYIQEARVIMLNSGLRDELGGVVVLSQVGIGHIRDMSQLQFFQEIRTYLQQYIEAVVIPRKWRIVNQLPVNAMGKTTYELLSAEFQHNMEALC